MKQLRMTGAGLAELFPGCFAQHCGLTVTLLMGFLIVMGVTFSVARADAPHPAELGALIEEAYSSNQDLLSLEENARALQAEAPFFGSLSDPVIGFGLLSVPVDTFALDQEAMTQKQLFVGQKFPWFGTLDLRQQMIEVKALEAQAMVLSKRLEVASRLAGAWYDLGFQKKSLEINAELAKIVIQVLRVAETRYGTGKGSQQDILAGQVQLSELLDEAVGLKSRERSLQAKIGGLLNRDNTFTETGPGLLSAPLPLPAKDELTARALQANPQIQARMANIDRARIEVELAKKEYYPEFDVRLSYGQREDNPMTGDDRADLLSATVALNVPLWQGTRQDSKLAAAEKRLQAAEKSLAGLRNSLPHAIDAILAEIDGARDNYELYRNALSVQATNLADASLAGYSVGKVDFNTMLAARVRLLRVQLKAESYKYMVYKKITELEELVGRPLSFPEGSR